MKAARGQVVYEKSLQIIKSRREVLTQSVGSKNVSLQNIAMNFCGGRSCFIWKNKYQPIRRLKSLHTSQKKFAQVFLLASYLRTQHNESALSTAISD